LIAVDVAVALQRQRRHWAIVDHSATGLGRRGSKQEAANKQHDNL
jgi:hypothetical protein